MLILITTSFLVLTLVVAMLVPQRGTPTWRTRSVSYNFSENYFRDNFVLKSAVDPEIVLVVCLYVAFNCFVCECCSSKQTHFIIIIKTLELSKLCVHAVLPDQTSVRNPALPLMLQGEVSVYKEIGY